MDPATLALTIVVKMLAGCSVAAGSIFIMKVAKAVYDDWNWEPEPEQADELAKPAKVEAWGLVKQCNYVNAEITLRADTTFVECIFTDCKIINTRYTATIKRCRFYWHEDSYIKVI